MRLAQKRKNDDNGKKNTCRIISAKEPQKIMLFSWEIAVIRYSIICVCTK